MWNGPTDLDTKTIHLLLRPNVMSYKFGVPRNPPWWVVTALRARCVSNNNSSDGDKVVYLCQIFFGASRQMVCKSDKVPFADVPSSFYIGWRRQRREVWGQSQPLQEQLSSVCLVKTSSIIIVLILAYLRLLCRSVSTRTNTPLHIWREVTTKSELSLGAPSQKNCGPKWDFVSAGGSSPWSWDGKTNKFTKNTFDVFIAFCFFSSRIFSEKRYGLQNIESQTLPEFLVACVSRFTQLAASLHPGCEKMKRKWRDNEEMERKWRDFEDH